jgi:hypothetical protein
MAQLTFTELVKALSEHPDAAEWQAGVVPGQALHISFVTGHEVRSETFEAADGSTIVLDVDADGQVCGIEIA